MKKLLIFSLTAMLALPAMAQQKKGVFPNGDTKRWMFGVQAGGTFLTGDARELGFSYAAGLSAQYSFSHSMGLRVLGNFGQVKGAEKIGTDRPYTKYDFTNNFWEAQGQFVVTFGNISFLRKMKKTNFYMAGGMGIMGNDATSTYTLKSDSSKELTGTFSELIPSFSYSAGLRYSLGKSAAIGLEYNFRYCGSDLVDVLQYNSSANQAKDVVNMVQLTLSFKLGKKGKEHVEWINPVEAIYEDIAKTSKRVDELSGDQDGDGVSDYFDKDNTTPAGAMVYGNGQAVDTDGDGVADIKDLEPNSPKGATVDENGQASDKDKDGVPDVLDLSPNTDTSYMVNHQGIPIMTKELARKLAPKGGLGQGGGIGYMPAIIFETGKSQIMPIHYSDLQGIAEVIKRNDGLKILIIGNADYRGSEQLNQKLALARAEAVKKVLVESFGVDPNRLEVQSNGEKVPIAKGTDPMSLQANRRVQFFIIE